MAALRPVRGYGRASGADETARVKLHLMPPLEPKPRCPRCHEYLVKRRGRHGQFYGCSAYPRCRLTLSVVVVNEAIRRHKERSRASVGK